MKDAKCPTKGCHAITGGAPCKRCAKARKPAGSAHQIKVEVRATWNAPGGDA